jgi:hypothetical protein
MTKNQLALLVCGTEFDQAPIEWQRVVEDMIRKGVTFGSEEK